MYCENCKKELTKTDATVCPHCQKYYCKKCAEEKNFLCGCTNKIGFVQ